MLRRHHYEQAFEEYLRSRRIPYVAVDEARKTLAPSGASLKLAGSVPEAEPLKSFDLVVYGPRQNMLVEIKGRRVGPGRARRLESWVTQDDVDALKAWEGLFGPGFIACFVFVYWCEEQPPVPLFEETFEHKGRWYAVRVVTVAEYAGSMRTRSSRWRTVHLPTAEFDRMSRRLSIA